MVVGEGLAGIATSADGGEEVRWLEPRRHPRRGGKGRSRRTIAVFLAGLAAIGAMPGSALGPIGPARASSDWHLPVPEPVDIHVALAGPDRLVEPDLDSELTAEAPDEWVRFGARGARRVVVESIRAAARVTGTDPVYLLALADKESGLRADARAPTSSAEGLFQFIEATWIDVLAAFGSRHGIAEADAIEVVDGRMRVGSEDARAEILALRRDPYLAALMAAELLKRDGGRLGTRVGRDLNRTELYLAHFLGGEGAARFLDLHGRRRAPAAARAFPAAAKANAALFFEARRRGRRGLSLPEVYARLDRMMADRAERYRVVAATDERI